MRLNESRTVVQSRDQASPQGLDTEKAVQSASRASCLPASSEWESPEPRVVTGFVQLRAGRAVVTVLLGATSGVGDVGKVMWVEPGATEGLQSRQQVRVE